MLSPRKVKHRKQHKGRMRGNAQRGSDLAFGDYALKAVGCGRLSAQQIEAGRVAINRKVKRGGQMWIRVFPDGHYYDVITNGIRNMPSYKAQIPVEDRWAIVAYMRALQKSQNASAKDVPEEIRSGIK